MLDKSVYWPIDMMRRWLARGLLTVLFGSLLWAGAFWNQKVYTEWTWHEINKILGNSPWATQQAFGDAVQPAVNSSRPQEAMSSDSSTKGVPQEQPVPAIVTRQYFIRLQSAIPIRMALARRALLEGRINQEQADLYVSIHPAPGYKVTATLVPRTQDRAELNLASLEFLRRRAYLFLKSSKKRVYVERYDSPSELGGWEAYLYFPRFQAGEDLFQLDEQEFTFICELSAETRLSRRFELKKMVFEGKLEI